MGPSGSRLTYNTVIIAATSITPPSESEMAEQQLEYIRKDTGPDPRFAVIWLHGLGADGHDFEPIVPELRLPDNAPVRFIFPHAPTQPVTINGGMTMRAWYDITAMDLSVAVDESGIYRSVDHLQGLIQMVVDEGIPSQRVLLAGFSQGGVIALQTGLSHPERLAGLIALSTYVALPDVIRAADDSANRETPIFMAHGRFDPVIPLSLGKRSKDFLTEAGYPVEWRDYPMEHSVHPEEIRDLGNWLRNLIE